MSKFRNTQAVFDADARLCILRTLEEAPNGSANEGILQASLTVYGHHVTRDKVTTLTTWLGEQGFVSVEPLGQGIRIIKLLDAGEDIVFGRSSHPGVKKPRRG